MALFNRKKTSAPEPKEATVAATVVTEKAPKAKATASRGVSALAIRTIVAPLATEKAAHLADRGVYAFLVAKDANRIAVKQAIRELYKVTPVKVNIMNVGGTTKRFGRFLGRTQDSKKALVTLPKGSHIDVFASV